MWFLFENISQSIISYSLLTVFNGILTIAYFLYIFASLYSVHSDFVTHSVYSKLWNKLLNIEINLFVPLILKDIVIYLFIICLLALSTFTNVHFGFAHLWVHIIYFLCSYNIFNNVIIKSFLHTILFVLVYKYTNYANNVYFSMFMMQIFFGVVIVTEIVHLLYNIIKYSKCKKCVICYEYFETKLVLVPCGYTNICKSCFEQIENKKCPICRNEILMQIKFFE